MRRLTIAMVLVTVLAAVAASWLALQWREFQQRPLIGAGQVTLWLDGGTGFRGMAETLERLGVARADWRWRLFGRLHAPVVQRGEYRLDAGMSVSELVGRVSSGDVRRHRFTIVEGWTYRRLRDALESDPRLRRALGAFDDAELMARLGCPQCAPEGRFLPETYFFVRGSTDLAMLERAYSAMQEALDQTWTRRDPDLPLDSPEQLLVLASLVERETGQADERSRIAGVFVRRLERGMRLQTDPTVMYGLGEDFDGRLRRVHLRTDHPWNTYTRHGLPPTPIALPGRAALAAAARPAEGSALYFVSRGDGSHEFSDTLAEHNAAVDRYIRGRP